MKMLFMSAMMIASASAFAAGVNSTPMLMQLEMSPGASPNPKLQTVTVLTDGRVSHTIQTPGQKSEVQELATLSSASVKKIRALIQALDKDAALVDESQGLPLCAGGSSSRIVVNIGMLKEKEIFSRNNCHTSRVEGSQKLENMILGLGQLAN